MKSVADELSRVDLLNSLQSAEELSSVMYARAMGASVSEKNYADYWEKWQDAVAFMLIVAWAIGAYEVLRVARIPRSRLGGYEAEAARNGHRTGMWFTPRVQRDTITKIGSAMPMRGMEWDSIISAATRDASKMRGVEQNSALFTVTDRCPELHALLYPNDGGRDSSPTPRGEDSPWIPRTSRPAPTPARLRALARGAIWANGLTQYQRMAVLGVLADALSGKAQETEIRKRVAVMGSPSWVADAIVTAGSGIVANRMRMLREAAEHRATERGQLDVARNALVREYVPLMRYTAIRDARTRKTHRHMHGYVATVEDIDRKGIHTPAGFNCRCNWIPMSLAAASTANFVTESGQVDAKAVDTHNGDRNALISSGQFPDPGFVLI